MARKYPDDPAWRMPSKHNAGDTLLIILVCSVLAIIGVVFWFLVGMIAVKARFWLGES